MFCEKARADLASDGVCGGGNAGGRLIYSSRHHGNKSFFIYSLQAFGQSRATTVDTFLPTLSIFIILSLHTEPSV